MSAIYGAEVPFASHLGVEALPVANGRTRLRCTVGPALLNNMGIAHGGVACTLLDIALGSAARLGAGRPAMTLDLHVSYLAPGRGVLTAEGWVTKAGRSIVFAEGEVRDEAGGLVARGSGVFKPVREAASG